MKRKGPAGRVMLIKDIADIPFIPSKDACRIKEIIHPKRDGTDSGVSLAWAEVEPGGATVPHRLEFLEIYYILEGRGLVHIDGETAEAGVGRTVYIPAGCVQHIENITGGPLRFLCICHPAYEPEGDNVV